MKKLLSLLLVMALLFAAMPALAAEITVGPVSPAPTDARANGQLLYQKLKDAADGDTLYLPAGTYQFSGDECRVLNGKGVTIIGAGDDTIITNNKYGLVIQNDSLTVRKTVTIKNLQIVTNGWSPIYIKNNSDVYLENVALHDNSTTNSKETLVLDSSNLIGGLAHDGVRTYVNAKNVTLDAGDTIGVSASPRTNTSIEKTTYVEVDYSNCTNISDDTIHWQGDTNIGFGNMIINGKVANALEQPKDASAVYGETATFTIGAKGAKSYQWQLDDGNGFTDIAGATGASYTTDPATEAMNGYKYRCIVNGVVKSDAATLTTGAVPEVPETGDADKPILYAALIAMAGLLLIRKRKEA